MNLLDQIVGFVSHPVTALLIGSAVTWFVAWRYYKRAGDELRAEAAQLQRTSELILRWLETKGENVELLRDEKGRPTNLMHHVRLVDSLNVSATLVSGELRTVRDDEK